MKLKATAGLLVFPAASVQVPESEALPLSGPLYAVLLQLSIPEVASVPLHVTVSAWLYQPLWSVPRSAAATTFVGGVASYLNPNVFVPVLPALSVQWAVMEALLLSGPL